VAPLKVHEGEHIRYDQAVPFGFHRTATILDSGEASPTEDDRAAPLPSRIPLFERPRHGPVVGATFMGLPARPSAQVAQSSMRVVYAEAAARPMPRAGAFPTSRLSGEGSAQAGPTHTGGTGPGAMSR